MYPFPVPDLLSYGIRRHLFKSISCLYLPVNPLTKWCVWFDLMEKKSLVHVLIYSTVTFVQILKSLSIRTLSHLLNQRCQTMYSRFRNYATFGHEFQTCQDKYACFVSWQGYYNWSWLLTLFHWHSASVTYDVYMYESYILWCGPFWEWTNLRTNWAGVRNEFYINCFYLVEIISRKTPDSNVTSCTMHETTDSVVSYKRQIQAKERV